jgi:tRNA threonylcarbamoyladenosine biosynthesis protein TsaE
VDTISKSYKDTFRLGKIIAKHLKPNDIICLSGKLGSGKTVLAKGIASGLGIEAFKVTSSSFVIVRTHLEGKLPFYHFDLYRIKEIGDILALGYEDYLFAEGVSVIEWAERLKYLVPKESLMVKLDYYGEAKRKIKFYASGLRYKELLKNIHEDIGNRDNN